MKQKVWLSSPTMHGEELEYIQEAFDTNWVAPLGKNVDDFEQEMCNYLGSGYAVAMTAGTHALHIAIKLAGIKRGDIVFCSDMTFAATVNPVMYEGGVPVFIDSETDTWNMNPEALKVGFEKYPGTKAVIVANLYGVPAKLDLIRAICDDNHAVLIEDAAESLSGLYKGRQTGTFGDYNVLSFNGNKIITTSGGGMLLTPDQTAAEKAHFWITQSRDPAPWYQHSELGYNYRMSNIVAGIGLGQMKWLEEHRKRKEEIYHCYKDGLVSAPVSMNPYLACSRPNFWLSCIILDEEVLREDGVNPESIRLKLQSENMESRPIWKPMHLQPYYAAQDFISVDHLDVGAGIFRRGLCLPSDIKMTSEQQNDVIKTILNCF